ncbi:MAG: SDR family NAD(P)-dependent oxidoreductase, partial [Exilibacterium sp.]
MGCTEVNRGGFMLQVDQFDAKFFGMSHREANLTDPQQRLFLQNVWHAIEHAGYNPECLAGSLTGVFCGIFTADYNELLIESGYIKEAHAITGLAHSILPNRVSYLLDLRGPSVPIDTACSSSLVALHQAIDSIRQGSCNMAIVGGVNVMASVTPYLSASRAGMISDACKTFDKRADGYARGEGVGAILIKPLSQALTDRDSVHAVIRGSAVNHGGAANSLTSPNPEAQADVIRDAMQRSGVSPHRINYIEAHGTGTSLGDPIEINGLKKAFQDLYKKSGIQLPRNHCTLGTVKSSIGHLEAAAGIAGLLKVILSLKHKKLHGNIHLQEINPYIDFEESPFYLIKENQDWEPLRDENGKAMPRCAGISSFGFGGTNSHIVIEEWNVEDRYERDDALKQEELITLSAKSEEQLKKTVQQLCQYLQNCECQPILPNIAFTLQSGRKHWPYRLAISCVTVEDLVNKLQKVSSGLLPEGVWEGYVDINKESSSEVLNKTDIPQHDNLEGLANLWLNNVSFDWDMFRINSRVRRVPLPTYIFDNKSHWIPNDNSFSDTSVKNSVLINNKHTSSNSDSINHFLLGSVRREVNQIIPLDKLNSEEYYFSDHQVSGHAILPAAFVIEIMRSAVSMATGKNVTFIEELCLINPISSNDTGSKLRLNLQSDKNDKILVTLESCLKSGVILKHSKALVNVKSDHETKDLKVSLKTVSNSCENVFKKDDIYQQLSRIGLNYGVSFQALTKLKSNEYKAVGHLKLPRVRRQDAEDYVLSPSMLDASMHSIVGIINCRNPTLEAALIPYKCKKIIVHKKLPSQCIVYTRLRSERENNSIWKFDIDIADIEGNILVEIVELELFEMLLGTKKVEVNKTAYSDLYYWKKIKRKQSLANLDRAKKGMCLIFHAADKNNRTCLRFSNLTNDVEFIDIYPGKKYNKNSAKEYIISHQKIDNFEKLFLSLPDYPSYIIVESRHAIDEVKYLFEDGLRHLIYLIKTMANHRKNSRCQLLLLSETQKGLPIAFAQTGFLKSVRWECPWLSTKIVHTSNKSIGYAEIWAELISSSEYVEEVFYDRGERFVSQVVSWKPDETDHSEPLLRNKGVYWITGGVGGIAKIIANYLVEHYQANLLLTGRRAKDDDIENYLKVIERNGGKAIYVSADVNNLTSLEIALDQCRRYFGSLTGVFHSAGLLRDGTLSNKSLEDFISVITPKINGIVNIDNVTSNEPLDIFVAFSSIVGVTGNIGQSDYASGNAFMDEYIRLRKDNNSRPGRSLSINWPLWEHGGMNIPENVKNIVYKRTGMLSLDTDSGLAALVTALKNNMEQIIVTKGDQKQIAKFINASHMEDQIHEESVTKENILLNIDDV